jgi:hypothetical protein
MNAIMRWGGGLLAILLFTSVSFGQTWISPVTKMPAPQAPDACGPGFYYMNGYGQWYGPSYCLRPPYQPFQGMLPGPTGQCLQAAQAGIPPWAPRAPNAPNAPNTPYPPRPPYPGNPNVQLPGPAQQQTGIYPTHPYVRGPRDFFMWNEDMEDTKGRDVRPNLVVP